MTDTTITKPEDDTKPCEKCQSNEHTTMGHIDGGSPSPNGQIDGGEAPVTVNGQIDGGSAPTTPVTVNGQIDGGSAPVDPVTANGQIDGGTPPKK